MKLNINVTRRNAVYLLAGILILVGVALGAYAVWQNRSLNNKLNQTNEKVTNVENNYSVAYDVGGKDGMPTTVKYEIISKSKKTVKLLDQTAAYGYKEEPPTVEKEVQVVKVKATNGTSDTATLDYYSLSAKTDKGLIIQQAILADNSITVGNNVFGLEPGISTEFDLYFDTDQEIKDLYNQSTAGI